MFFVVYSDRGLVFEGEPALKLFNILYWLVVAAASVCGCAYYLMLYNGTEYKEYLELLSVLGLDFLFMGYLENKKRRYVGGQCLNQKTMAAFGGKRRQNIFSWKDTINYFHCMQLILLLDLGAEKYPLGSLYHYILHGTTVTTWTFVFAVYIPIKHYYIAVENFPEMFREEKKIVREGFYVRNPDILIPRHPCNIENILLEKALAASRMGNVLQQIVSDVSIISQDYTLYRRANCAENKFQTTVQIHIKKNENDGQYFKKKQSRGLPEVEI